MNLTTIAVDGPAGSGKSTVAKLIAKRQSITYLDTGAMYRAVTLKVIESKISLDDDCGIKEMLKTTEIDFIDGNLFLDGVDVSEAIRMPEINQKVSSIASKFDVREKLVTLQQNIASNKSIIMDGRDIGTKVLPNATYKFFLIASIEERAKRRFDELTNKGIAVELADIIKEIEDRDYADTHRENSPLVQAEDAILIDTTTDSIDDVVTKIIAAMEY